jgi:hypothetical protein
MLVRRTRYPKTQTSRSANLPLARWTNTLTTFHNKTLHDAWKTWNTFTPDLAVSIQPNRGSSMSNPSDAGRQTTIASIKRSTGEDFLAIEKAYFNTEHVAERISKRDRISGVGVIEKTSINPHSHIGITLNRIPDANYDPLKEYDRDSIAKIHATKTARLSAEIERNLLICFLLEQCNSPGVELEERDREFLKKWEPYRTGLIIPQVIDWKAKGRTIKTTLIYNAAGWREYMFKEQLYKIDFSDQVFTLADFHSGRQRTKPTRHFTVDRVTHARHLNLDEPLQPRR